MRRKEKYLIFREIVKSTEQRRIATRESLDRICEITDFNLKFLLSSFFLALIEKTQSPTKVCCNQQKLAIV